MKIRKLEKIDYPAFAKIANGAFEGLHADKWLQAHIEDTPSEEIIGLFKNEKLVAGMRMFDFEMNFASTKINVGGLGMLAVDLLHKKEKNALYLINHFLQTNREKGTNLVMLHPFSASFYQKLGFGLGTKVYQYNLSPDAFKNYRIKEHLVDLTEDDKYLVHDCYNRIFEKTHGMTKRFSDETELLRPFRVGRIIGYKVNGQVKGYLKFSTEGKELHIHELMFETPEVIKEFSTLLSSQADQFHKIVLQTNDEGLLSFVLKPESGLDTMVDIPANVDNKHIVNVGLGVMYRIVDVISFFEELKEKDHRFQDQTVAIKFNIVDQLLERNQRSVSLGVKNGLIQTIDQGGFDVEVDIDIGYLSSLLIGGVQFKTLYRWGLVTVSDDYYVTAIDNLFRTEQPVCTKAF